MRAYSTKIENSGATVDGRLSAAEDSVRFYEMTQAVNSAGITLDPYLGPDVDQTMLAQAIARYASGGVWYQDTGAANAYVLSTPSGFIMPKALFGGMRAHWIPGASNTTAAVANVAGLGTKSILRYNGGALSAADVATGRPTEMFYSPSANDGAGAWLLEYWVTNSGGGGGGGGGTVGTLSHALATGFVLTGSSQSAPNNIWTTVSSVTTTVNDSASTISAGAITVNAADVGYWTLSLSNNWNSGAGIYNASAVAIIVNGTTIASSGDNDWQSSSSVLVFDSAVTTVAKLAASDVVTVMIKQASGSTQTSYNFRFAGTRSTNYTIA